MGSTVKTRGRPAPPHHGTHRLRREGGACVDYELGAQGGAGEAHGGSEVGALLQHQRVETFAVELEPRQLLATGR